MVRQTRREFLKTLGVVAGLSMLPGPAGWGQTAAIWDRPNILFIMTDDHASHAMSCYGSKINRTPNLDRIAREGMRFTNSFCTNSICALCWAVILTGKHSHINGLIDNRVTFDGSQQTFPKLFHFYNDIDKWELYDLQSDPDELKNLYPDAQYADVVQELKAELKRLRAHYKDTTGAAV